MFNFLNQWVQLRYNLIHAEMATEQQRLENLSQVCCHTKASI